MDTNEIILVGLMAVMVIALGGLLGVLFLGFRRSAE